MPNGSDLLLEANPGTYNQQITVTNLNGFGRYYVVAVANNGCNNRDYLVFLDAECGNQGANCSGVNETVAMTNM